MSVKADPEQLRKLAQRLSTSSSSIQEELRRLEGTLNQVDWDDDVQRRFDESFRSTLRSFQKLAASFDEHVPWLQKKAAQLEAYLGGR